jgi:hypothetical protein
MKNASLGMHGERDHEDDAYRARMLDQCREIRRYRRRVMRNEERCLTLNEAAREWIDRFAASYAESRRVPRE